MTQETTGTNDQETAAAAPEDSRGAPSDQTASEAPGSAADPRIAVLEAQVGDLDDKWRRAMAEMENVRRRADIQIEQGRRFAIADFAKAMLAVADNLRRAMDHVPAEARANDEAVKALCEGVDLTAAELGRALEKFGIVEVPALGARFDPKVHDALYEVPLPDQPAGMVIQVIEAGYMIHDRLLRPAKVGVSKGGPKAEPLPPQSPPEEAPAGGAKSAYDRQQDQSGRPNAGSHLNEEL